MPQLLSELVPDRPVAGGTDRNRIVLAGNIGSFDGIADLVAGAVERASTGGAERV